MSAERLGDDAYNLADDTSDAERAANLARMYQLIGRLGKVDKAIIMLWLDEHSYEEIASIVGITRQNVASRLFRIRNRLAEAASKD